MANANLVCSTKHEGILMRLFLIEFLQFLLCNLRYKRPNRTDLERLTESVFEVELKTSLARTLRKKIVLENLDMKWIKVPSVNSVVTKYLSC